MVKDNENKSRERERKIQIAKGWMKALRRLAQRGMYILLRTNGEFGGIVIEKVRKKVGDDYRLVIEYLSPEGRLESELLDFKPDPGADPEDCRPIHFIEPFILTPRVRPGFDDDRDSFEWISVGRFAQYYENLKQALKKKQAEIHELMHQLEVNREVIKRQENEIDALSAANRQLSNQVRELTQELVNIRTAFVRLEKLTEELAAAGEITATAMRRFSSITKEIGMYATSTPIEQVNMIAEELNKLYSNLVVPKGAEADVVTQLSQQVMEIGKQVSSLASEIKGLKESFDRIESQLRTMPAVPARAEVAE